MTFQQSQSDTIYVCVYRIPLLLEFFKTFDFYWNPMRVTGEAPRRTEGENLDIDLDVPKLKNILESSYVTLLFTIQGFSF
jgi:hypothetical protein